MFVVPEAATVLFLNGASVDDFSKSGCSYAFQQFVIKYVNCFNQRNCRHRSYFRSLILMVHSVMIRITVQNYEFMIIVHNKAILRLITVTHYTIYPFTHYCFCLPVCSIFIFIVPATSPTSLSFSIYQYTDISGR